MRGPLHIVSFDNPFPPVYGGVIDVYYKVRALHKIGYRIQLHCFVADIPDSVPAELSEVTDQVFFYRKRRNLFDFLSAKPYSVMLRRHPDLKSNLEKTCAPILFEGLKPTAVNQLASVQKKILRLQNIEQDYFFGIAKSETNVFKKLAYWFEGLKYEKYEPVISEFDAVVTLSRYENQHVQNLIGKSHYIPLFHGNEKVLELSGSGEFAIYAADFNTPDNRRAAAFIIDVFTETDFPLIITGSGGEEDIKQRIGKSKKITFVKTQSYPELQQLLASAHINVMFSFQKSGSKLKVVNGLFNSRHCLINENMIDDPELVRLCHVANNKAQYLEKVKELWEQPFEDYEERKAVLEKVLSDVENAKKLAAIINE
ncbi:glycosyltransferase family protein [Flavobacterium silvaticum]|uniref:Glycosyltransferase family 4 protein n=1 Tax=Flavobacterium silvaticum TaxID=1852020 RepID=A0A972FIJ9_9FLAO|nr:hypothetical protein [Flavobacterium silvaticum]NMH26664.1 glycosyltransferase family 4 protein [Flavobacterium silvaticum]